MENILRYIIIAAIGAVASILANQSIAVFNDGLRPVIPEYLEKRMDRKALAATSFAIGFGLVIGYGLPTSIAASIILIHCILLTTDIIGTWCPDTKKGLILSGVIGAVYGVALLFGLQVIIDLFNMLPVNFLGSLGQVSAGITLAFAIFPAVTVALQFGAVKGGITAVITLLVRQIVETYGKIALDAEHTIALNKDGMALLAGMIIMLVFAAMDIFYHAKNSNQAGELDFTYYNAVYTVENALAKVKDDKGMKRVEKFLREDICPECHGSRLSAAARAPKLRGISLDEACQMTLEALVEWVKGVPGSLPEEMRPMAESICEAFESTAKRLMDLGLGYLTLDRSASTLSTGERQRMQLARAVRNRTTGVLYVLDEPSIGLHPSNIVGLTGVMHDLVADGNSVILVDHDTQILKEADWVIEMGPEAGAKGGHVIAEGTIDDLEAKPESQIGPFLSGKAETKLRRCAGTGEMFAEGGIHLSTGSIHTVKPLELDVPKGRLTVVTGVSGSGKTTMVLESLVPALEAKINGSALPAHIREIRAEGIAHVKLIDATPIGINVRSTVATYAGVHDELRKLYARSPDARQKGFKASDFSYNTGSLRCPGCDGTGEVSLDVQFLPDVNIVCPDCRGSRYARAAYGVKLMNKAEQAVSLPQLMEMDVNSALAFCGGMKTVSQRLRTLQQLGLGYLTLGEETPSLSGGEAQRLKLASEIGRTQTDSVFVFDEPSIGLHPLDVQVLLRVFQALLDNGATVVVIEHDLDVIRNADYVIDMGPGGGESGGRVVATGTPEEIRENPESITGRYL